MNFKLIAPYVIYLLINSLFIIKYGSRLDSVNSYLIAILYMVFHFVFFYLFSGLNLKKLFYKYIFFLIVIVFFGFTIVLNIIIDGNDLNVDRWSAMEVGVEALFNNEYPYSAIDHLGGRTSNLPTLIFMGIPFYLFGDVGFLQSLAFLVFTFIIYKSFSDYKNRLFCLLLLVLSPSYFWELYVKSDLMSNLIFVLLFMLLTYEKIANKSKMNTIWLSFISTALLLTRLIVIIPITLLLFKYFYNYSLRKKIAFSVISLVTSTLFFYICLKNVPSLEHFMKYNPFDLQNRQLPTFVSVVTVLLPLVFAFKIKGFASLINYSIYLLLLPIFISFAYKIYLNGIMKSLYESYFDISYLNIIMPFLLVGITFNKRIMVSLGLSKNENVSHRNIENL